MTIARSIVVLGSLNIDMVTVTSRVPDAGETFTAISFTTACGGKGNNQAVGCARAAITADKNQDIKVVLLGATGTSEDDPLSDALHATLRREGIDSSAIERIPGISSGTATILVEEQTGENRILVVPGANGRLDVSYLGEPKVRSKLWSDGSNPKASLLVMQLEIPLETVIAAIEQAKSNGVPVLLNPAPAIPDIPKEILAKVDHLVVNETEAEILLTNHADLQGLETGNKEWCEKVYQSFGDLGIKQLIVTLGEKGACFTSQEGPGYEWVPAEKVDKVVDTTAAGDTFVGAYAVAVVTLQGKAFDTKEAVIRACKASALTVQKAGAISSIPKGIDY